MPLSRNELTRLKGLAAAHQYIADLGKDKNAIAALNELQDDPELWKELFRNPAAFAKSRGIPLPKGAKITVTRQKKSGGEVNVQAAGFGHSVSVTIGAESNGKISVWCKVDAT